MTMQYFCGIDIGAATAKLVIIDEHAKTVAKSISRSGVDYTKAAEHNLAHALADAKLNRADIVHAF